MPPPWSRKPASLSFMEDRAAQRRAVSQWRLEMRSESLRNITFLLLATPLLLTACASEGTPAATSEVSSAVSTADASKAEADKAMQTAQQALQTAQKAQQEAQAADQRADKMYNRSLKK
jgi:outer membrane murein-binding lipoprotein Lpp